MLLPKAHLHQQGAADLRMCMRMCMCMRLSVVWACALYCTPTARGTPRGLAHICGGCVPLQRSHAAARPTSCRMHHVVATNQKPSDP